MRRLAQQLGIRAPSLYKHFTSKAQLQVALVADALYEFGEATHRALHDTGPQSPMGRLLRTYRMVCCARPNLYRLATSGPLARADLPDGLEEWAGNPWFVVTGDPSMAQALWSFAHGMVILELDGRYPADSDLDRTWQAGESAFATAALATAAPGA